MTTAVIRHKNANPVCGCKQTPSQNPVVPWCRWCQRMKGIWILKRQHQGFLMSIATCFSNMISENNNNKKLLKARAFSLCYTSGLGPEHAYILLGWGFSPSVFSTENKFVNDPYAQVLQLVRIQTTYCIWVSRRICANYLYYRWAHTKNPSSDWDCSKSKARSEFLKWFLCL